MIELPKDAEGREIPLDTEVLYDKDGHPKDVSLFTYAPRSYSSGWNVVLVGGFERFASAMHLTPPDSWERLLDDLDRCSNVSDYEECAYFGTDASNCLSCVAGQESSCSKTAMRDIASRIRKLSGEGE